MHLSQAIRLLSALFLTAVGSAQQARFRDEVFPAFDRTNAIAYGTAVNQFTGLPETLLLDLYQPQGDPWATRPAFVVVHGGGFVGGSRAQAQMVSLCSQLARAGYVAISIDYRLAPPGTTITASVITAAAHDFQAAVRWLRANAATRRIDTGRLAALGSSAGAYTVLASVYDDLGEGSSGNPGHSSRVRAAFDLWGALQDVTVVEAGEPPLFLVHGTNDPTVPFSNAQNLVARAQAVGLPYELHAIPGAGHAPWAQYTQLHFADTLAFAWQHLRLAELVGVAARPGFASPGTLTIDQHGLAGSFAALWFGDAALPVPVALPGLGALCLDPAGTLLVAASALLPTAPRIATTSVGIAVPGGLAGFVAHWQAVEFGSMQLLTNCIATPF
jgi:acetyl esterase/lipase